MATTQKIYAACFENMGGGNTSGEGPMDLLSDTLKGALCTSSNSISQTADTVYADLTNELAAAGGYSTGGVTLASKTWAVSSLTTTLDAADPSWSSATFTARQLHFYDDTPTSPADPLLSYVDFGADETISGGTFTVTLNASGIWAVTVA